MAVSSHCRSSRKRASGCSRVNAPMKSAKYQLEAALRVLWGKFRNRLLLPDDELQLRDEIHHELAIRAKRLMEGDPPPAQLFFVLRENWTDQALEGLCEGRIGDVSLVLVELA